MDELVKSSTWDQFGAAIDMLEHAVEKCPERLWKEPEERPFWYVVYHALFWLDLYLTGTAEGFAQPAQFKMDETDPNEVLADVPYTKDELQNYLRQCREKCREVIGSLTEERARENCVFPWGEVSFFELLLYNMRHVQGHAAELLLRLGDGGVEVRGWIGRAGK